MRSDVIKDYGSGYSMNELAQKYALDNKTIKKILVSAGIPIRPGKTQKPIEVVSYEWRTTKQRDEEIIRQYQEGRGAQLIARSLGIGKRTVYRVLKQNKIEIDKTRSYGKNIDMKFVVDLYKGGESVASIGRKLNVSSRSIVARLAKLGFSCRKPGETMGSIPLVLRDQVVCWYREDQSTYDISERLKLEHDLMIHPNSIQRFLGGLGELRHGKALREHIVRKQKNKDYRTKLEKFVEDILIRLGVEYEWQFSLGDTTFDFRVGDILIEANGDYWHSLPQRRQRDSWKFKKKSI